jgi:hypothetical protein
MTDDTKLNQAQILTAIMDMEYVFVSMDGETCFATVEVNGHKETWPIRSKGFRRWLVRKFYATEAKPPGAQAVQDALGAIESRAQFGGDVHPVFVRLAYLSGDVYLDLGNERWEAVEVTVAGWRVVADPPVKFRRAKGMLALPRPEAGGSLEALRPFVNIKDENQWIIFVSWLVAAARPTGPYPVLAFVSEHGTAKSTSAEVLRRLIDPNSAMLRAEPRDVRDVMVAARNSWIVALDNLSEIPAWLSDCLCRLATGGGFSTRELYTDQDEIIFDAQRPVILNGIDDVIDRGDLIDRAVFLDLPRISEERRRPASDFWRDFEAAKPRILGALLDVVSAALRNEQEIRLPRLPRMADFARWAAAAAPALGWTAEDFIESYSCNRSDAHEVALDASPVSAIIRALADRVTAWTGTAAELLDELNRIADEAARKAKSWPPTPRAFGSILRRLTPNLRAVGVEITFQDKRELGTRRRQIEIQKKAVPDRSHRSHRSGVGFEEGFAFPGNDDIVPRNDNRNDGDPLGNKRNDGNDVVPAFSKAGEVDL